MNETLRSYTRRFFETRVTIANITDEDVIRCFQNRLFSKHTYHDFGRNRLTTAVELRDMMARWAGQKDEENNWFPKRNHDKQSNCSDRFDKSQRIHSENTRKRKPDHEFAAVEHNRVARSRGTTTRNMRKSCTNNG
jgi:hypothetical protein